MPLELDPAVLVVAEAGGLGLALGDDLHPGRIGAEPRHVIGDRLRAALGQRDVVLLGAGRVGVAGQVDALALGLLGAGDVGGEPVALAGLDRRVVEREVHGRQRAARVAGAGAAGLAAEPLDAVLVIGALIVLGAWLGRRAQAGVAAAVRAALAVGGARLALAGLTDLALRTLTVVLALGGNDASVGDAGLPARALVVLDALDALAGRAHLVILAVLVGLAARLGGVSAARHDEADPQRERAGGEDCTWT